jgi:L-2,4-diaminobutyrate decarboxylase
MYDDLAALAKFCESKKLWFHVDAAHGGGAIFSGKYSHLLKGIHRADSIVIDGHKMLMTPTILTFLLFKDKNHSYATFSQKAQYLLGQTEEEEWYNIARKSFECTKRMMSIQFYSILKFYGEEVFDEFVTRQYDLGRIFAQKIGLRAHFDLPVEPHSNIVCFRYHPDGSAEQEIDEINSKIRDVLLKDGSFYIVQTQLNGEVYLRTTLASPKTTEQVLDLLLDRIEEIGKEFILACIS